MSNFAISNKTELPGAQSPLSVYKANNVNRPLSINGQPVRNETLSQHTSTVHFMFQKKLGELNGKVLLEEITEAAAQKIFQPRDFEIIKGAEETQNVTDLKRAFVVRAVVKSTKNDFPFPVKFGCSVFGNLNGSFDTNGRSAPVVIHSGENLKHNTVIHDISRQLNHDMVKKYGHLDPAMLESGMQVWNILGVPTRMVPVDHPIVKFMRKNPNDFTAPSDKNIVEGMYKMNFDEVNMAIDSLKSNVVDRFNSTDLTNIKATLERYDGRELKTVAGSNMEHLDASDISDLKSKLCTAHVELQIDWTTPKIISNQSGAASLSDSQVLGSPKRLPMDQDY